ETRLELCEEGRILQALAFVGVGKRLEEMDHVPDLVRSVGIARSGPERGVEGGHAAGVDAAVDAGVEVLAATSAAKDAERKIARLHRRAPQIPLELRFAAVVGMARRTADLGGVVELVAAQRGDQTIVICARVRRRNRNGVLRRDAP